MSTILTETHNEVNEKYGVGLGYNINNSSALKALPMFGYKQLWITDCFCKWPQETYVYEFKIIETHYCNIQLNCSEMGTQLIFFNISFVKIISNTKFYDGYVVLRFLPLSFHLL